MREVLLGLREITKTLSQYAVHRIPLSFRYSFIYLFIFKICFNCLLMDQITKVILVDTLVHPNKPVDLVSGILLNKLCVLEQL